MSEKFDPRANYEQTQQAVGYVERKKATQADYDRIGFMSGLEVHQQLATKEKLFCRCPAGIFQKPDEYDAELLRHMRPTLSEMGEYDGTALMEFKTRKNIVYRIAHRTACTYEVDDTPPFPINPEALQYALEIALASKLKIVGEVHITRKQYLDGSIPTGFQRTAILGIDGEIQLKHKKVRLIQLSVEEDACREVSDIGHTRIYRTDRLGMPLIETVTYPDMVNPDEVEEACNYIRFLNRSTGRVRTGIGAGREDVNVSCKGGTRIEVKGVSHTKWIPEVTHVECFRQWSLLAIRDQLVSRIKKEDWKMSCMELDPKVYHFYFDPITDAIKRGEKVAFVGKNGAGKSTLVKCIMGEIPFDGKLQIGHNVKIGYFAQNQAQLLDETLTVHDTIDYVAVGDIRTRINDILGAFMFGGKAADKKVKVLSGGEKSRLAMIRLLLQPVNLLILDEPTNHLDMPSKDVLKEALQAFEGTVIVVSHDRDFLNGIVNKVYEFGDHRVCEHLGGIYDFLRKKQLDSLQQLEVGPRLGVAATNASRPGVTDVGPRLGVADVETQNIVSQGKMDYQHQKERERRIRQAEKKVKTLEVKIAELEQQLAEIEVKLSAASSEDLDIYYTHSKISRELEEVMAQWETAGEELERAKNQQ